MPVGVCWVGPGTARRPGLLSRRRRFSDRRGVARQYGVQKVDLAEALALLAELEPLRSTRLVLELRHRFDCSERAAKDAISILRRGDWIEHGHRPPAGAGEHGSQQEAQPRPADGKRYGVNERGHSLLAHPNGPRLLRIARKLFTTCPSPKVRRFQQATAAREGLEQALRRFEHNLLSAVHSPPPRTPVGVRPWNIRAAIREAIRP